MPGEVDPKTKPTADYATADKRAGFDPEDYRMTLGEHLEELRRRILTGLIGGAIALVVCLYYGDNLLVFFSRPLLDGLKEAGLNPQMHATDVTNPFMLMIKVAAIVAGAFAAPWMVYQLWLFVAAGLYPKEQKVIKRYIPLSITLLISGIVLAYVVVMPLTVRFLLAFNASFDLKDATPTTQIATTQQVNIPVIQGDPVAPANGAIWFNEVDGKLKLYHSGKTSVLQYATDSMLAQTITMDTYVDMTLMTLLVFGLAFQLPLVVLALHAIGIVNIDLLRRSRKIVWLALALVAAVIAPGDVVSAMMALYIPLILLFEFGIWLCLWRDRKLAKVETAE